MKIAEFSDSYFPILDGVSMTVKNYAEEFSKLGCNVDIITPKYPGYIDKEKFRVIRYFSLPLPMRKPYRMGFPLLDSNIHKILRNQSYEIVHTHSPFSAGKLALYSARNLNVPIVATFHSKYREDLIRAIPSSNIVDQIINRIVNFYEMADEVWVPQEKVADTLREYGFKGKIEVVLNGTDFGNNENFWSFRQSCRQKYRKEHKKILLYVGQIILEKNLPFLIESLKFVRTEDVILYIVGEGYALEEIRNLIFQNHLQDKVRYKGLIRDRKRLAELYTMADLFVFPSLYDNAPLVVREAAAMGTPSLLLREATAAEVIRENFNGFLTENSAEMFAQKIDEILKDEENRERVGLNAANTLVESWSSIVEEVNDRYRALIKRKARYKHLLTI